MSSNLSERLYEVSEEKGRLIGTIDLAVFYLERGHPAEALRILKQMKAEQEARDAAYDEARRARMKEMFDNE